MKPRKPIRRRKLYEDIVAEIEAMIHSGELTIGEQLPSERELMEVFGVGRTSVREALFALQRMGLIAVSSGERARVVQPTPSVMIDELAGAVRHLLARSEGVGHFQQARAFFEIALARYAAEHRTEEDLLRLREALAANRETIDDLEEFQRTDVPFHYVLSSITRNPIFTALHDAMAVWLREQRTVEVKIPGAIRMAYEAHERIYEAIAAGDPERAGREMREHLDEVARQYWMVKGEGDNSS